MALKRRRRLQGTGPESKGDLVERIAQRRFDKAKVTADRRCLLRITKFLCGLYTYNIEARVSATKGPDLFGRVALLYEANVLRRCGHVLYDYLELSNEERIG